MTIKKKYISSRNDLPENWYDKTVILWEEDDAPVPDKERTEEAFKRITGTEFPGPAIYEEDHGDAYFLIYRGGWVKCGSCEGGWVGCILDI